MRTKSRGIRLADELDREIAREAEQRRQSWSAVAVALLEEGIRMRRAPGIVFADGPAGRRAVVAGTGLDVWEIVATWRASEGDYEELQENYPWLSEAQLRAALGYYEFNREEIDTRLEREVRWTSDRVSQELPFARPARPTLGRR